MGWLIAALARIMLLIVWLATPLMGRAFGAAWLLPVLGFIFLPITTIVYVLVYAPGVGVTGWNWALIALAVLFDLSAHGAGVWSSRRRIQSHRTA